MAAQETVQFVPFTSYMDAGFLHTLSKNKLEIYGLDENPVALNGFFSNGDAPNLPSRFSMEYTAFNLRPQTPNRCYTMTGELHLKNTIESFKNCEKKQLNESFANEIWQAITSGLAEENPQYLLKFILLMYIDMKKYHYYYWFCFPALCYPADAVLLEKPTRLDKSSLQSKEEDIIKAFDNFEHNKAFFIIYVKDDSISFHPLHKFSNLLSSTGKVIIGFADPSTLDTHPGWPLRNLLALAGARWSTLQTDFEILGLRDRVRDGKRSIGHSLMLSVRLILDKSDEITLPGCVGWEKNERQKLGPRLMNMSSTMDPIKLSESSVDLNLKLMKWRLVPTLDIDKITQTKCLLLGSGTLGCNVARTLLGWGVRNITLVDNSKVSYSNPVRQTLFKFNDCLHGGKPKAEAAASALHEIFPGVNAAGITLSIPMPGHPVDSNMVENVKHDVELLENLICSHDVIFLLMDTRESRWLPTVIAAAHRKLVINAALGFDTFLVLRHGLKSAEASATTVDVASNTIPGSKLGCYFCNDVVAPGDSTRDRTLDQQCTVTRPGISMVAAALAVELMVSVVHHPSGGALPAIITSRDDHVFMDQATILGVVPHSIRGFLCQFTQILPASYAFDKCTACSDKIIEKYSTIGFPFLLSVFNQPSVLEDITGLTELHDEIQADEVWELSD